MRFEPVSYTHLEIKQTLSRAHPYNSWLESTQIVLEELNPVEPRASRTDVSLLDRQQAFGYTQEDLALLLSPMATTGQEAVGSMEMCIRDSRSTP